MSRPWVVLKYGGTSVANVKNWGAIVKRVKELLPTNRVWLVVSALSGVTNALLRSLDEALAPSLSPEARLASYRWITGAHAALAGDMGLTPADYAPVGGLLDELKRLLDGITLTQEVSPKLRARVAAFGELLSSQVGVAYLRHQLAGAGSGGAAVSVTRVDARSLLTSVDADGGGLGDGVGGVGGGGEHVPITEADRYLEADVRPSVQPDRANAAAQGADVVIAQGFIASTPSGATCLLGRGGSDTSGALFAAYVGAARLEIWTDVNGMFTADPRYVPSARLIRSLTYREAQELAAMGAKVLHPRCLLPAAFAGIPVQVRNTLDAGSGAEMTVVSASGTDYARGGNGSGSGSGDGDDSSSAAAAPASSTTPIGTPAFSAMPPVRSPSPLSSARLVYNTAGSGGGGDANGAGAASGGPPSPGNSSTGSGPGGFGGGASSSSSSYTTGYQHHHHAAIAAPPSVEALAHASPKVLAVARRKGVTLVNMSAFDMWGHAGFLSKVFAPFTDHGVSVDLIATSQYAVSVTLDHIPDGVHGDTFRKVVGSLGRVCATTVRYPCAVVSVVGRGLRHYLPQLGAAMAVLRGVPVHMVSEASEDLNLSFVVDEEHADRLVKELHGLLLEGDGVDGALGRDPQFGPPWAQLPCGGAAIPGEAKH